MSDSQPPLEYLVTSSQSAVESFELARLNRISNLRKEIRQIVDEWIAAETDARIARWILDCRRAQAGDSESPQLPAPHALPVGQISMPFASLPGEMTHASAGAGDRPAAETAFARQVCPPTAQRGVAPPSTNTRAAIASKDAKAALRLLEHLARSSHAEPAFDTAGRRTPRRVDRVVQREGAAQSDEGASSCSGKETLAGSLAGAAVPPCHERGPAVHLASEHRHNVRGAAPIRSPLAGVARYSRRLASAS
jgi:hypothetical protein